MVSMTLFRLSGVGDGLSSNSHALGNTTEWDGEGASSPGAQATSVSDLATRHDELQRQVSALKQEVLECRRTGERTAFALVAARIGIRETALDTGRVTWSDSQAALFGVAPHAFAGTTEAFLAVVHPEDRSTLRQEWATALANGSRDVLTEFRTIRPDGSIHWVQERARIVRDPTGRPVRVLGVNLDVTDMKLLEAQFQQAQKMEAIGFAEGVAQEFNNMLTAILGYSALLAEQIGPDEPMVRDLRELTAAAERAAVLTRQLLTFSRRQVPAVTPLNMTTVVRDFEAMLRRLLGEQITITTVLADNLDPVMANVTQLEYLLVNLCENARDAMPQGGGIILATRNITVDAAYAAAHPGANVGAYATLSVADTGAGMSSETQARIFEPFFTINDRGCGKGLGLAAVHGVVKQLAGYIEVQSQLALGSIFTIYLPKSDQAA
jgi:two-component system cell cycle sensor histidine kinase/response regulator CckA